MKEICEASIKLLAARDKQADVNSFYKRLSPPNMHDVS
jgi:hypothetical protein